MRRATVSIGLSGYSVCKLYRDGMLFAARRLLLRVGAPILVGMAAWNNVRGLLLRFSSIMLSVFSPSHFALLFSHLAYEMHEVV